MGDLSNEPSMEDILSSIKRIIAEEGDGGAPSRGRRIGRAASRDPIVDRDANDDNGADDDANVLELDQPVRSEPARHEPLPPEPPRTPEPPRAAAQPIAADHGDAMLSSRVAEATRGQLDALSRMLVKPEVPGSDSLEGMVREMLKPMLSAWLDANLPRIVEAMVAREIARISSQRD